MLLDKNVQVGVESFTDYVIRASKLYIPFEKKVVRKNSHPCLNDICRRLVLKKHAAHGTPEYDIARNQCSEGLYHEYSKYVTTTKIWLETHVSEEKHWWKYAKSLLLRDTSSTIIPALQLSGHEWFLT